MIRRHTLPHDTGVKPVAPVSGSAQKHVEDAGVERVGCIVEVEGDAFVVLGFALGVQFDEMD